MINIKYSILFATLGLLLLVMTHNANSLIMTSDDQAWEAWKVKYGKSYASSREEDQRRQLWTRKVESAVKHNKAYKEGLESYSQAVYEWADQEYRSRRHSNNTLRNHSSSSMGNWIASEELNHSQFLANTNVPDELDYRSMGYVTSVDDQKGCGICWIFSVVGAIEGLMKRTTGRLEKLSVQQILDCNAQGDDCKSGGLIDDAMKYAAIRGLQAECDYPFAKLGGKFDISESELKVAVATIGPVVVDIVAPWSFDDYEFAKLGGKFDISEPELKVAVATIGPVVVDIVAPWSFDDYEFAKLGGKFDISEPELKVAVATIGPVVVDIVAPWSFDDYEGDIYSTEECQLEDDTNHSILIVGYGTDETSGKDYWILKNSYGTQWGENGYMRFQRNIRLCSIGDIAVWPIASK